MARRDESLAGGKVFGPYKHRRRWRLFVESARGERHPESYETKEEADQVKRALERLMNADGLTVCGAIQRYERYLLDEKGNKPGTVATTMHRLHSLFDADTPLARLTSRRCEELYATLRARKTRHNRTTAVDTHRNALAECKTFLNWCVKRKWLCANPLAQGKPSAKPILRRWSRPATFVGCLHETRDHANEGATARRSDGVFWSGSRPAA